MSAPKRTRAPTAHFTPAAHGPLATRWQRDWSSDEEDREHTAAGEAQPKRAEERRERKRRRLQGETSARQEAKREDTEADRARDAKQFIQQARNQNTHRGYTSAWQQFVTWVREVENPNRAAASQLDEEHPSEVDVAQYCRYIVEKKGNTMSSVHGAIAGIADHLRFDITTDYNPCTGKVLKAMISALVPRATPAEQKKQITFEMLMQIGNRTEEAGTATAKRDFCMFQLAYHTFLRASEVVRMKRDEITFGEELLWGETHRVMRVHVNRMCKNDAERKGHERLVLERAPAVKRCMVRQMQQYIDRPRKGNDQTLFPKDKGGEMSRSTPNHRLQHWLEQIGVPDPTLYGFHSLRAGGATDAATAGVHERDIKAHGNWKSEAVRVYIRPSLEDRLAVSRHIGV
jgi:integrase